MDHYDVIVIGSGFGGAVACARIAAHFHATGDARTVLLLEKGNDNTGRFDPSSSPRLILIARKPPLRRRPRTLGARRSLHETPWP